MWRLSGFKMSEKDPNVIRLHIHLPNQQMLTYIPGEEQLALATAAVKETLLTGYFSAGIEKLSLRAETVASCS
jgi:hypothetical protein